MTTSTQSTGFTSGASAPLGATVGPNGVNFSVFSKQASLVELLLFDGENAPQPTRVIPLDAEEHRTYHYWHVFVPGLQQGQVYAYRAHGPFVPDCGYRFDGEKVLLDPYGLAVAVPETYDRRAAARPGDTAATAMKSVVADPDRYDWEGDLPLKRPFAETVIYELHVKGFTRHVSSGVAPTKRGTYAGLIQKVPYLKDLGVTAVELLPVFQFDPQDAPAGTTGAISRFHSSRHITRTARSRTPSPFLTNFGTWSKRSTARKSKSFSMSSLITPQKVA